MTILHNVDSVIGYVMVGNTPGSDSSWKCTDILHDGWTDPDYDDSLWPNAVAHFQNGSPITVGTSVSHPMRPVWVSLVRIRHLQHWKTDKIIFHAHDNVQINCQLVFMYIKFYLANL